MNIVMFSDVAGSLEVPGVADDKSGFEALLLHYFVGLNDIFLSGLGGFFNVNLVREDAIFEAIFACYLGFCEFGLVSISAGEDYGFDAVLFE